MILISTAAVAYKLIIMAIDWTCLLFLVVLTTTTLIPPTMAVICPTSDLIAPCKCVKYFNLIDCDDIGPKTNLAHIFRQLNNELERHNTRPVFDQFKLVNSQLEQIGSDGDILAGVTFRRIHIARNSKLKRISPDAFRSSFNITTELVLEDNEILGATEEDNVNLFKGFNSFVNLRMLHLADSAIHEVPDNAFHRPQPVLRELFLTDNRIERIGDNAFTGLNALELVNLDGNQISKLSPRSLELHQADANNGNMLKIFLRSNKLSTSSFPPTIFNRLRRRVYLNLNINNITSVTQSVFQSFFFRHNVLSLYKNPIKCDCSFKWLFEQGLLYNSSDVQKKYQLKEYQCTSERDDVEQIITEVDEADFEHCPPDASTAPNRACIEQSLDAESEDACLNGGNSRWSLVSATQVFCSTLVWLIINRTLFHHH